MSDPTPVFRDDATAPPALAPPAADGPPRLDEEPAEHVPGSFLAALPRFFVFPAILVATLAGVYLLLRVLAGAEPASATELLADVAAAGPHGRAQLLHTLADGLRRGRLHLDDVESAALQSLWERTIHADDPPEMRRDLQSMLLLVLAEKGDPALTPYALQTLDDPDPELRRYGLAALAVMADPAGLPALPRFLASEEPDERDLALAAVAAVARRQAEDGAARALLAEQLRSSDEVLGRAAALQLGLLGDERARAVVAHLLSREAWSEGAGLERRLGELDADSRRHAHDQYVAASLAQACEAAVKLGRDDLLPQLRRLRDDDPSPSVKSAALDALHALQGVASPES